MPRKKKDDEEVLKTVEEGVEKESEEETDSEELQQFISDNSETSFFATVSRKAANGQFERIGKYSLSSCDLDALSQEYGGGTFRVRVTTEKGVFVKQFTTTYAVPRPKPEPKGENNTVMNLLMAQNQQTQQLLIKALEVMGARSGTQEQLKVSDILQMMTSLKTVSSGSDTVQHLIKGLEMGLSLGEKTGENVTTIDRIVEAVPMLAQALQTRRTRISQDLHRLKTQPTESSLPAQAGAMTSETLTPKNPTEARIFALLSGVKGYIQSAEKAGIPAEILATYLSANIDDTTAAVLLGYLNEKDAAGNAVNITRLQKHLGLSESYMNEIVTHTIASLSVSAETTDAVGADN